MIDLINRLYNSSSGMLYFYLIIGIVSLFFIVLIILTIRKGKKEASVVVPLKDLKPVDINERVVVPGLEGPTNTEKEFVNNMILSNENEIEHTTLIPVLNNSDVNKDNKTINEFKVDDINEIATEEDNGSQNLTSDVLAQRLMSLKKK